MIDRYQLSVHISTILKVVNGLSWVHPVSRSAQWVSAWSGNAEVGRPKDMLMASTEFHTSGKAVAAGRTSSLMWPALTQALYLIRIRHSPGARLPVGVGYSPARGRPSRKRKKQFAQDRRKLMSRTVTGTILEATELPVESSCIFLSEELQLEHERSTEVMLKLEVRNDLSHKRQADLPRQPQEISPWSGIFKILSDGGNDNYRDLVILICESNFGSGLTDCVSSTTSDYSPNVDENKRLDLGGRLPLEIE
ncbi:hypothetical protein BD769DRAFT_1393926 [Suillus cothurnatus]|nr:hypothetical protein BD769DRAFT_1393926 [Suillus cothurnatus]